MSPHQASPARTPLCPSLPPEIWIHILQHTDPAHLWLTCRRVSTVLRACAERAFSTHFLRDIKIDFALEKYNLGGHDRRPEVPVRFSRLGTGSEEERGLVWFRDKRPQEDVYGSTGWGRNGEVKRGRRSVGGPGEKNDEYEVVMRRWEMNVNAWRAELPHYTIRIKGYVNDTPLPGLALDREKREVRFRWKDMLTLFFREVAALQRRRETWETEFRAKAGPEADLERSWAVAERGSRKEIRRARLREFYKNDEEMLWAIESLKYLDEHGGLQVAKKGFKLDAALPGAGLGERWFGRAFTVQGLFIDEWSCTQRLDVKGAERRDWARGGEGERRR